VKENEDPGFSPLREEEIEFPPPKGGEEEGGYPFLARKESAFSPARKEEALLSFPSQKGGAFF